MTSDLPYVIVRLTPEQKALLKIALGRRSIEDYLRELITEDMLKRHVDWPQRPIRKWKLRKDKIRTE